MVAEIKLDELSLRRIKKAFEVLPDRIAQKVLGSSARFAMTPVIKEARRRVPVEHGVLRKSLGSRLRKYRGGDTVFVAVGPRNGFRDPQTGQNPVNYAHLVEFGTGPHAIRGKKGVLKIGGLVIRGGVHHPGARPQPFLRPALDTQRREVRARFNYRINVGIERELKKLAVTFSGGGGI
jgi:HK97 gp10 family phage protein